jgi:polyphosphate kinase
MARIHSEILPAYLADTVKARLQQPDGLYLRASKLMKDVPQFSSQEFLMQLAEGKTDLEAIPLPPGKRKAKPAEKTAEKTAEKDAAAAD